MNSDVTLSVRLLDNSEGRYQLALAVRNESANRLLIPWPEIIGFRFQAVGGSKVANWGCSWLQSSSWGGGVLQPGEAREFVFSVVACSATPRPTEDDRWCVDLQPGAYDVSYRLQVDADYFDPDSHYRLPQMRREAESHSAEVWLGEAVSNELRLVYAPSERPPAAG
jgi:hypothetical protein